MSWRSGSHESGGGRKLPAVVSYARWPSADEHPVLARIRPPRVVRRSARLIALALPMIALVMLLLPWRQTSLGTGEVISYDPAERAQEIQAPVKGRIVRWNVREGQRVEAGDLIVEIADNDDNYAARLEQKQTAAEESVEAYTAQLEAERATLNLALAEYDAKLAELNRKRAGDVAELEAEKLNLDRQLTLSDEGIASQRKRELAISKYGKARSVVEARDQEIAAVRQARGSAEQKALTNIAKAEVSLQEARQKLLETETDVARQSTQKLMAPLNGVIQDVFGGPGGKQVKTGDVLAVLVPDATDPAVELYVDGNDMPLVQPGEEVRLLFEGWPAIMINAWPYLSTGTFGGEVAFVDPSATDGKFRVVILPNKDETPWPEPYLLRQGVQARGWILLNEVTVGYELWRQINGFPVLPKIEKGNKPSIPSSKKPRSSGFD